MTRSEEQSPLTHRGKVGQKPDVTRTSFSRLGTPKLNLFWGYHCADGAIKYLKAFKFGSIPQCRYNL